ncbi:2-succinyl-6-hydroxy-2,4-cyclohexadiene-1-carboxylate synthase [Shewanella inventionis]|uniref:2-succinyl-6-hydroxy-2, 4-cyclohexadiene-1-carboxylate synthase n=1 Tax=Shewanella inventionis TaxID=1738770 RepID=UPI001CBBA377|nr:2-succinyl-6-hydroxy-2,4-cyclohexadiene-1-carboxylate synthase [Shewanella inventionis]
MGKTTLMVSIRRFGHPNLPALVMLHGFLGSKDDWSILMPSLSQHFHCICIDLPGHGANHLALTSPGFSQVSAHILAKVNELGVKQFHLLGYSLGGRIALHIAKDFPEALLSLTLESAHPGLTDDDQRDARANSDGLWAKKLQQLPITAFLSLWYQQAVFNDLSKQQKQQLITLRSHNDPLRLSNCYLATSLSLQQDCRNVLSQLSCPCYYLYGEDDTKFAQVAIDWQTQSGQSALQLQPLNAAGHNIHSLHPALFCDTLLALLTPKNPAKEA